MIATEQHGPQHIDPRVEDPRSQRRPDPCAPETGDPQGPDPQLDSKILQELIYDRVRGNVNLCQLVILEQELEESIQRVIGDTDGVRPKLLALEHLKHAWDRLEREWNTLREELGVAERA